MAGSRSSTRIGDTERAEAQHALDEHLNAGRLQVNEFADRSAAAAAAVTAADSPCSSPTCRPAPEAARVGTSAERATS